MGWLWLAAVGLGALAMLRGLGVRGAWLQLSAAALLVGGAGYAFQHNAALPGRPVTARTAEVEVDPGLVAFRSAIMPPRPADRALLAEADRRVGRGDTAGAAQLLLGEIERRPRDALLWTQLGTILTEHDRRQLSPSAQFAFRRAIALAPEAPGPPFFLGLSLVKAGDLAAAREAWRRALDVAPVGAGYRADIAVRILLIDQVLARQATPPAR